MLREQKTRENQWQNAFPVVVLTCAVNSIIMHSWFLTVSSIIAFQGRSSNVYMYVFVYVCVPVCGGGWGFNGRI